MLVAMAFLISACVSGPTGQEPALASKCWDTAMTTPDMRACAAADLAEADRELNLVYQRLLEEKSKDPVLVNAVRKAQRAWLAFRDSHVDSVFPELPDRSYGSLAPMCMSILIRQLTLTRIEQLKQFLEYEEGEVCSPFGIPDPKTPHRVPGVK